MSKIIDITGMRFGRLIVLEKTSKPPNIKDRSAYWKCKCDCGNIVVVSGMNLRRGNTQSCGCLQKEKTSKSRKKDITGQKFGKLTAMYPSKIDSNKHITWHCKCDCGNECDINISSLTQGLTKSCGCGWHNSFAINQIKEILNENNIFYEIEKNIKIDQCNYYFDLYINNNYFIEYDGEQHFHYKESGWNNKKQFENTRKRDLIKNKYCFKNKIPLIRIPYNIKNITINDLLLSTTKFLLTSENEKKYYGEAQDE